jgi:hypothetical protein
MDKWLQSGGDLSTILILSNPNQIEENDVQGSDPN